MFYNECSSTYFWSALVVHAKWARQTSCIEGPLGGRHKVSLNNFQKISTENFRPKNDFFRKAKNYMRDCYLYSDR